ncbi:hypothetical protein DPMN_183515 [Dreissena polymorpha]|uniref:Uncharacterized protein n=1 Tax=Dreissena polymorpha TaxID=45954 RepID=A0A9D4DI95_DREPO|nr:hypothetical protein DPMN_183515 [Dreissena polymorpha]
MDGQTECGIHYGRLLHRLNVAYAVDDLINRLTVACAMDDLIHRLNVAYFKDGQ